MVDLTRAHLEIWLALFRDTKPGGTARASLADLARRAGIDRQTASRAVGELVWRKMLRVLRRGSSIGALRSSASSFRWCRELPNVGAGAYSAAGISLPEL
jgi:hypothetical protein